jgi:hypothetical protein
MLRYYDIEYLNLTPNGIFHTSIFVHFYEAYVGSSPLDLVPEILLCEAVTKH